MSLTVFTQRNFVADFLQAKCDFTRKTAVLHCWAPFGGLGATYDDHLRLIGKRIVDFLLVLLELFSPDATVEALRANIHWKSAIALQRSQFGSKFHAEGVAPHQPFFLSQNPGKWSFMRFKGGHNFLSFCHKSRVWQTDRRTDKRTDRQTEFSSLDRVCIPCSAVKTSYITSELGRVISIKHAAQTAG